MLHDTLDIPLQSHAHSPPSLHICTQENDEVMRVLRAIAEIKVTPDILTVCRFFFLSFSVFQTSLSQSLSPSLCALKVPFQIDCPFLRMLVCVILSSAILSVSWPRLSNSQFISLYSAAVCVSRPHARTLPFSFFSQQHSPHSSRCCPVGQPLSLLHIVAVVRMVWGSPL